LPRRVLGLASDSALIDGEAVELREDERSDFRALLTKRGGLMAALVAFDLLRLDGDDPLCFMAGCPARYTAPE
jgi:ATP-dependent DNA ligase